MVNSEASELVVRGLDPKYPVADPAQKGGTIIFFRVNS